MIATDYFHVENDVPLICLEATFFPDKVLETHQQLHRLISNMDQRRFYGLSWYDDHKNIVY